ncbi:MAG: hypothetical protein K2X08_01840 [Chlamydiales bacterium]|nr:hypothetical protein [Chlamydiales bacterium]
MKFLSILLSTALIFPIALVACSDETNSFGYHGKNGKNGQNREDGQKGENGGFFGGNGGNGGKGGRGGKGGKGGNGGFFGGNGGNGGNGGEEESSLINAESKPIDEWEYKILKDSCRMVIAKIEAHLTGNGDVNVVAIQQILKSELSNYLLSQGTPASLKIYTEYEMIDWKYPAIKDI